MKIEDRAKKFIHKNIGDYSSIELLRGYASDRTYYRIYGHNKSYILCLDNELMPGSLEEFPFYVVHRILKRNNIPIPEIVAICEDDSMLLLEDLGDQLLEYQYKEGADTENIELYKEAIGVLLQIHQIKGEKELPFTLSFDVEKLMYEFDFFIIHGLCEYYKGITNEEISVLREEFFSIAAILNRPDLFVFSHRDFITRNILIKNRSPYIIDFQHARMGLPQYDLVSILRDDYVVLRGNEFSILKDYYYEQSKEFNIHSMDREEFDYLFDIMSFERNIKVVGSFGYQIKTKNNRMYEKYIENTKSYLYEYAGKYSELQKAWSIIKPQLESCD